MAKKETRKTNSKTAEEYERMGRQIEALYDSVRPDKAAFYRMTIIKGLLTGAAGVIGATVLVALLLWILSFFDSLPLIGGLIDAFQDTVDSK